MNFEKICDISNQKNMDFDNKIFLTFDIDWCSDEVLKYTLNIIEKYNIKTTFFVTHKTKLLHYMQKNKNIELGIHPNFNFLLNGDFRYGDNIDEVIEYYLEMVPNSISVRSHSMTQSSIILSSFAKHNIKYDCNHYIPKNSGILLYPWQFLKTSLFKIPYFWEDDFHCIYNDTWDINEYINYKGLKVFDFHPIHIFLNTENLERYEKARPYLQDFNKLKKFVNNETYGTRDFLIDLIEEIKSGNS